ncbi:transcriptional regulator [Clostridium sp. W14A]|uniref:MBOAT family protein n=1 Tax=Caproicibacter fermentans TaxID=2576756 RepID=A0A7G8TE81_9FIRM|nr:MBOAT family O-acyltransferase [Caproicibacter fermentans]OCN00128.1 transcriptional regulator [Clostridium sp. W14A]QNK41922.1 MBOAT family protein [Caproicibacter fermentans]
MLFSSLFFIFIFLPVSLAAYYLLPRKWRNLCLFAFSLVFYAWGEPVYVFLMLFTAVFDYAVGTLLERFAGRPGPRRAVLVFGICVNLGMLAYFKYAALFVSTVNSAFSFSIPVPAAALPIGISFYTFESLSYAIDIYRGEAPAQKSLIDFGTYVSFFPHLISGPIIQYKEMQAQLRGRTESMEHVTEGALRFLHGLFKKVLLANNLALIADKVQYFGHPSALSAWLGALAFTFQIYFDFSGYTDMAIGLGRMFGFILPENFNLPYSSRSASDFWRRWHMTLGRWFRDYLYIPLGGNRCSTVKLVRNLAVVWVLTGFWHGSSWNFAVWGAYWGFLIICEKLFLQKWLDRIPVFFQWLYAFLAAVVGWVFFSYTDLRAACGVVAAMFGFSGGTDSLGVYALITGAPILLLAALFCTPYPARLLGWLDRKGRTGLALRSAGMTVLFLLSIAALVDNSYNPFLYFRF